jgi:Fe(3+) dicitrate transport protein
MSGSRVWRLAAAWALAPLAALGQPAAPAGEGVVAAITVIGTRSDLQRIPGSGATIERQDLVRARVFTVNEALRQVSGVFPRDEEGLGLRPNIGVRGLSPVRSTKVLLLEDGLPLAYAPYGDNATYSHPPVRRFERIEVLKGAGQIRFGPNTVGGVVNYITPDAPNDPQADLMAAAGARGYREIDASAGGAVGATRLLAHANSTKFDGVRANHALQFDDLYLKAERALAPDHEITLRLGRATEDSQVSYSGLTEAEFAADPYGNPFPNDRFETARLTGSATHAWQLADHLALTTSVYSLWFDRDWWRQSSNSGQRPNDASDPTCGGMANLNTTCGNEGRLREYQHYGLETRLGWTGDGVEIEAGARFHAERQNRLQVNSDTPAGRSPGTSLNAGIREINRRYAKAWSGYLTAGLDLGRLRLSPGVRIESIAYERLNALTGERGKSDLTEIVPGLGATFDAGHGLAIYAGVHRGFAPPRVEDVISNAGGVTELDAETSTNWELGLRGDPVPGVSIDIAGFVMDFENQIVPSSVAGGVGATLTSAGETRHTGVEASLRASLRDMGRLKSSDVFVRTALTWVPEAEFKGARFSNISGFAGVSVSGNRGYAAGAWLTLQGEAQYTGRQFSDDLNTLAPTANGQRGLIKQAAVFNIAANLTPRGSRATYFLTVKNVFDKVYIVDRARGILPGAPRLIQGGVSFAF